MEPNEDVELRRVLWEWEVGGAPDALEARVMSASRRPFAWWALAATMAAMVVAGAMLSSGPAPPVRPPVAPLFTLDTQAEAEFVPVPYVAPLDSYETGTVIRVKVTVASLLGAGYRLSVTDPAAMVVADVLIGDDGRAHAVRLVGGD